MWLPVYAGGGQEGAQPADRSSQEPKEEADGKEVVQIEEMRVRKITYRCSPPHCGSLHKRAGSKKTAFKEDKSDLAHLITARKLLRGRF